MLCRTYKFLVTEIINENKFTKYMGPIFNFRAGTKCTLRCTISVYFG